MATPVKSSERNSTVAEAGDQKAVRETLFLVKQGVNKQIKERENCLEEDFDQVWDKL